MHPSGDQLRVVAVIPARFGSTRFPGKALADVAGLPMVVRVAKQVAAARVERVLVATDDARIAAACEQHGVWAVMTGEAPSGTDRVAAACRLLKERFDRVVNVQGDEPLLDPRDVDALVACTEAHPEAIATLARPLEPEDRADPNRVKVVTNAAGRALYFSRASIPGRQHVGIYGFTPELLDRFTALPPSPLEEVERLEQLRALENGIPIQVAASVSERPSIGVDTPDDLTRVLEELNVTRIAHGPR